MARPAGQQAEILFWLVLSSLPECTSSAGAAGPPYLSLSMCPVFHLSALGSAVVCRSETARAVWRMASSHRRAGLHTCSASALGRRPGGGDSEALRRACRLRETPWYKIQGGARARQGGLMRVSDRPSSTGRRSQDLRMNLRMFPSLQNKSPALER